MGVCGLVLRSNYVCGYVVSFRHPISRSLFVQPLESFHVNKIYPSAAEALMRAHIRRGREAVARIAAARTKTT